jgi:hypothetical protein
LPEVANFGSNGFPSTKKPSERVQQRETTRGFEEKVCLLLPQLANFFLTEDLWTKDSRKKKL